MVEAAREAASAV